MYTLIQKENQRILRKAKADAASLNKSNLEWTALDRRCWAEVYRQLRK